MKKILAIVLTMVMMFAVCVPAFAADLTINDNEPAIVGGKQNVDSKVYTSTETDPTFISYEVTIPAETKIAWGATSTELQYSIKTQLDLGKRLAISATSQNGLQKLTNAGTDKTLPYTFSATDGTVLATLSYTTDNEIVNATRAFNIDIATAVWNAAPVAEYADYLTFTVEVVDA